jgi:orotate phosphoribosyltransferase
MKDLLLQTKSLMTGHFELSSGLHSNQYFQCAKLLQYPEYAEKAGRNIASQFDASQIDVVVGPALGGIIIGYEVARALNKKSIFTERKDGDMTLRRGFEINSGEKVLIIEDVITTAKSTRETISVIQEHGGVIAGIGCIVDRSKGQTGLEIRSLLQMDPETFDPDNCPLCQLGHSLEKPGSRIKTSNYITG